MLISDPLKNEEDDGGIIDSLMQVKQDGHIQFYSLNELDELFMSNGFVKGNQIITNMKFPFAQQPEYINIYNGISDQDRDLYQITNENGVVWVYHINVGNTIFVKI